MIKTNYLNLDVQVVYIKKKFIKNGVGIIK